MLVYVIRRLGQAALVLAVMATLVFIAVYAVGDPVAILASPQADQQEMEAITRRLGLDRPLYEQYALFVWNALHGDLGRSFVYNEPALTLILNRLPATLELALTALLISIFVGIPLGLYAGLKPQSLGGHSIMAGSILGFSLPNFWQGMMLIMIFSVWLGWLPASGRGVVGEVLGVRTSLATWDGIAHLILPALNLALFQLALVIRLTRTGVREVAGREHAEAVPQPRSQEERLDAPREVFGDLRADHVGSGIVVLLADRPPALLGRGAARIRREPGHPDGGGIGEIVLGVERLEREPALGLAPQRVEARAAEILLEERFPRLDALGLEDVVDAKRGVGHVGSARLTEPPWESNVRGGPTSSLVALSGRAGRGRGSAGSG